MGTRAKALCFEFMPRLVNTRVEFFAMTLKSGREHSARMTPHAWRSRVALGACGCGDRSHDSFAVKRWGEAARTAVGRCQVAERRITVSDRVRRPKNAASNRDVPIPEPLAQLVAAHRTRYPGGPRIRCSRLPLPTTTGRRDASSRWPHSRRSSMTGGGIPLACRGRTSRSTTSATPSACTVRKQGCRWSGCRSCRPCLAAHDVALHEARARELLR